MGRAFVRLFFAIMVFGSALLAPRPQAFAVSSATSPVSPSSHRISDIHRLLTQYSNENLNGDAREEGIWLNTSRPLKARDLQGRILLLDFWTFCCINCIHIMPDLKHLEDEFKNKLTVIGVHSAKFTNEKDSENIRNAIIRYDLRHPVVNDASFDIWNGLAVDAWPTLIVVDPDGDIAGRFSGEGHRGDIEDVVRALIKKFGKTINTSPLPIKLEKDKSSYSSHFSTERDASSKIDISSNILSYPGKIALATYDQKPVLIVSDSSHDRIVGLDISELAKVSSIRPLDGGEQNHDGSEVRVLFVVGKKGIAGDADGHFATARFNKPQGLLVDGNKIYVADTGNHLLRLIDLEKKQVTRLVGTGKQGDQREVRGAQALKTALSSPWDLAFYPDHGQIVMAMAGLHQLWFYDVKAKTVSVLAGSGAENIVDGVGTQSSLAQTSGLSVSAKNNILFFVDSETSSLRELTLEPSTKTSTQRDSARVSTLIGEGLFEFGFKDGKKDEARLQHPIGVLSVGDHVYVADSYNHSIRDYDLKSQTLLTLAGNGTRGFTDGDFKKAQFNEPNDIILLNKDLLLVADTNNNALRLLDLKTKRVSTVKIKTGRDMNPDSIPKISLSETLPNLKEVEEATLSPGDRLRVKIELDSGWHINEQAPSYVALFDTTAEAQPVGAWPHVTKKAELGSEKADRRALESSKNKLIQFINKKDLQKEMLLTGFKENHMYRLQGILYYCPAAEKDDVGASCVIKSVDLSIAVVKNEFSKAPKEPFTFKIILQKPKENKTQ